MIPADWSAEQNPGYERRLILGVQHRLARGQVRLQSRALRVLVALLVDHAVERGLERDAWSGSFFWNTAIPRAWASWAIHWL